MYVLYFVVSHKKGNYSIKICAKMLLKNKIINTAKVFNKSMPASTF